MSKQLTVVLHYEVVKHVTVEDDYEYVSGEDERIEDIALANVDSGDFEFVGWEVVGEETVDD